MSSAKSWCKVASNLDSHPKIRKAGRNGREVFLFALRRNAEPGNPVPGRLPLDMLEPWYLADQLMMSESEAVTGVTACCHAGLIIRDGDSWVILGWDDDWGKTATPGSERTAKWRKAKAAASGVTARDVTPSPESHGDACDALDQRRGEEKRSEEKRSDQPAPREIPISVATTTPTTPPASRSRGTQVPSDWIPERSEPNEKAETDARAAGVHVRDELARMIDWAKSGGKTGKDWNARWRNWLREAIDRKSARPARAQSNSHGGVSQRLLDMANGDT